MQTCFYPLFNAGRTEPTNDLLPIAVIFLVSTQWWN